MRVAVEWKKYLQWQKPMATVLTAAALPTLAGVYSFGWRVAAVAIFAMFTCWLTEYLFTRQAGKPASMASLVSGILLALILPPGVPFWVVAVGCVFSIVFGKMAFGGFGKNVYNPSMVGRCFLYICFPVFVVTTWTVPYTPEADGPAAGFTKWSQSPFSAENPTGRTKSWEEQPHNIDAVTSATVLRSAKNLNQEAMRASASGEDATQAISAVKSIPVWRLFLGNINGCMGETSALAILLALAYLIYRKTVFLPLVISPVLGLVGATLLFWAAGMVALPIGEVLLINLFGGGAMFAVTFMTTEPVSAPRNNKARWIYGALIGTFAVIIRMLSIWPAGLMFSVLLANTLGPIIEIGCDAFDAWQKEKAKTAGGQS